MKNCESFYAINCECAGCGETHELLWTPVVTGKISFCKLCLCEAVRDLINAEEKWANAGES